MKRRITAPKVLFFASAVLMVGLIVAYYNTSSFGYDNANLLSFGNEEVWIMNFRIEYKDILNIIKRLKYWLSIKSISF